MEAFLVRIRDHLANHAPNLLTLFDVMAGEARFARAWLDDDLKQLPKGAALLEVGGGTFILSCQLAREGFNVTAIEPTGVGFSAFEELGAIVLSLAKEEGAMPTIVRTRAEDFVGAASFDFAYSVNVMEHVDSPPHVITRVVAALKLGAAYRFFCPNYAFPYEPHFNIPIIYSKALTARLFAKKISQSPMDDAAGVWQSLNWISVGKLRQEMRKEPSLDLKFKKTTLVQMLERAGHDEAFAARRSRWMVVLVRWIVTTRLHTLASFIPVSLQPLMDVTLARRI